MIVEDEVNLDVSQDFALDLPEELAELGGAIGRRSWPITFPVATAIATNMDVVLWRISRELEADDVRDLFYELGSLESLK